MVGRAQGRLPWLLRWGLSASRAPAPLAPAWVDDGYIAEEDTEFERVANTLTDEVRDE